MTVVPVTDRHAHVQQQTRNCYSIFCLVVGICSYGCWVVTTSFPSSADVFFAAHFNVMVT